MLSRVNYEDPTWARLIRGRQRHDGPAHRVSTPARRASGTPTGKR